MLPESPKTLKANPAFVQALRESVRTAPYPHLIGMTLAAIGFDSCRIELDLGERQASCIIS